VQKVESPDPNQYQLAPGADPDWDITTVPDDHDIVVNPEGWSISSSGVPIGKTQITWTSPSSVETLTPFTVSLSPPLDGEVFIWNTLGYSDTVVVNPTDMDIELPGFDECTLSMRLMPHTQYYSDILEVAVAES